MKIFARVSTRFLTAVLLVGLSLSGCDKDRAHDTSGELINAFGGACSPAGLWTRNALKQNGALAQTFENLIKDDPCKDSLSSLMAIQNAVSRANALLANDAFLQYRAAEEELQDLTLALQTAPADSDLEAQLKTQLILAQLNLYQTRAVERASQTVDERDRYAQSTADLAQYLQTIMTAQKSGGMAACLKAHPEAAVGIAGNLLALGGSFVSPVYGAGFAVVGQILSIGVDYASHSATEDAIWNLHSAAMPTALTCGLESMTELYCGAEDSFALLELKKNSTHGGNRRTAPIWKGIDLLNDRMPVLNEWLSKVKNGIAPTDPGLAEKQNRILDKMNVVDKTQNSVFASLSENEEKYNHSDEDQKPNSMVNAIRDQLGLIFGPSFSGNNSGRSTPNPFLEQTTDPRIFACWLVLGMKTKCPAPSDSFQEPEQYIRDHLLKAATFQGLFDHWKEIHDAVKTQVDKEFNRTITANPSSLIADAYESTPVNVSPRKVLEMLVSYLSDLKKTGGVNNPAYKPFLDETTQLIQTVLKVLDLTGSDDSATRIGRIYQTFQLNRGLQIFSDRITRIVEWDLNARIKNGEFPQDLSEILKLAGAELKDRLVHAGQGETDSDLEKDLNNARSIAQANISAFRGFFDQAMGKSAEMLHKAAVEAGEPLRGANRPNGQMLGHLCTLILATGEKWPSKLDPSICENAFLDPLYAGPGSPAFSIEVAKLAQELQGKPYRTRFCAYHRYMHAERLAEIPPMRDQNDWTTVNLLEMMTAPK